MGEPVAVSSPQGRFVTDAELVDGRVLESAEAHGKHLFHHYGPDLVVHVHLGLYGKFSDARLPADPPRGQVRMRMVGASRFADLRGPTACEPTPTRTAPGAGSPARGPRWRRCSWTSR